MSRREGTRTPSGRLETAAALVEQLHFEAPYLPLDLDLAIAPAANADATSAIR